MEFFEHPAQSHSTLSSVCKKRFHSNSSDALSVVVSEPLEVELDLVDTVDRYVDGRDDELDGVIDLGGGSFDDGTVAIVSGAFACSLVDVVASIVVAALGLGERVVGFVTEDIGAHELVTEDIGADELVAEDIGDDGFVAEDIVVDGFVAEDIVFDEFVADFIGEDAVVRDLVTEALTEAYCVATVSVGMNCSRDGLESSLVECVYTTVVASDGSSRP